MSARHDGFPTSVPRWFTTPHEAATPSSAARRSPLSRIDSVFIGSEFEMDSRAVAAPEAERALLVIFEAAPQVL